jgi:hypothetical protein
LNFGSMPASCALEPAGRGRLLLSTTLERDGEKVVGAVRLAPNEGAVIALES